MFFSFFWANVAIILWLYCYLFIILILLQMSIYNNLMASSYLLQNITRHFCFFQQKGKDDYLPSFYKVRIIYLEHITFSEALVKHSSKEIKFWTQSSILHCCSELTGDCQYSSWAAFISAAQSFFLFLPVPRWVFHPMVVSFGFRLVIYCFVFFFQWIIFYASSFVLLISSLSKYILRISSIIFTVWKEISAWLKYATAAGKESFGRSDMAFTLQWAVSERITANSGVFLASANFTAIADSFSWICSSIESGFISIHMWTSKNIMIEIEE